MKRWILAFMMLFFSLSSAQDTASFEMAETLFQAGQIEEALTIYTAFDESYQYSDVYWYNLGTLYAHASNTGLALSALYTAQRLNPRDPDLTQNIAIVERRVSGRLSERETLIALVNKVVLRLTPLEWLSVVVVLMTGLNGLLVSRLRGVTFSGWRPITNSVAIVLLLFFLCYIQSHRLSSQLEGVVTDQKVALHAGPSTSLSELFYVHAGQRFRIEQQVQSWSKIVCPNGAVGWIVNDHFSFIH